MAQAISNQKDSINSVNRKKTSLINIVIFIFATILFWINFIIMDYLWLYSYDKIYTILQIILYITLGVMILYMIKILLQYKNQKAKNIITICILMAFAIHCYYWISFSSLYFQTSDSTNILSKNKTGSSYSFTIIGDFDLATTFRCTEEIYNDLIVDENVLYSMSYRSRWTINKQAVLCSIDTKDIIDNRNK